MTTGYLFRTPEKSKFFSISLERWSYRESTVSTFSYWTRTCQVWQNLQNTLTMLSSEVDRICSSSVWEEISFCWNKKTVNELIIILLKKSPFSRLDDNASRAKEHQKKYLKDVVVRRRQNLILFRLGRHFFLLKKKTVNKMSIILLNTSTFSYWTRTCHVSQNLKMP